MIQVLVSKAIGVFIWARLVAPEILDRTLMSHDSPEAIWNDIDEIPRELTALYRYILERAKQQSKRRSLRMTSRLFHAIRQLNIWELRDAMTIDFRFRFRGENNRLGFSLRMTPSHYILPTVQDSLSRGHRSFHS